MKMRTIFLSVLTIIITLSGFPQNQQYTDFERIDFSHFWDEANDPNLNLDSLNQHFTESYYDNHREAFKSYYLLKKLLYAKSQIPKRCWETYNSVNRKTIDSFTNHIIASCPDYKSLAFFLYQSEPLDYKLTNEHYENDSVFYTVKNTGGFSISHHDQSQGELTDVNHASYEVGMPAGSDRQYAVDSAMVTPDVNFLNNHRFEPVSFELNKFQRDLYNEDEYKFYWRPDLWYNHFDGAKVGAVFNGGYMNNVHNFELRFLYNTGLGQYDVSDENNNDFDKLDVQFLYNTATPGLWRGSEVFAELRSMSGLKLAKGGMRFNSSNGKTSFFGFYKLNYIPDEIALQYMLMPYGWGVDRVNSNIHFGLDHNYQYNKGYGNIRLEVATSALLSDYSYSYMQFESKHEHRLGKLPVRTRIFGQMGFGEDWAPESSLYLSGANPLEMVDNPFTRAAGIVPAELAELGNSTNTFHHSGGLNLRGYSGYLAPYQFENGEVVSNYRGTSGAAFNAEILFTKLSSLNPFDLNDFLNFESYLFGDAGILNVNSPENDLKWGDFRADAGIGVAIKVKWGKYNDLLPLNIRVDLPLFLNRPPSEEEYVEMRYIIGISQPF
ncbi:BamA/TamA family outer membrane protein [Salibacter halophilus]|nr:hypothetical protein [Salibacter halophilus]